MFVVSSSPESSVAFLLVANSSAPVSSGSNRNRAFWAQKKIKTKLCQMFLRGSFPLKLPKTSLEDPPGSDKKPKPQPFTLLQARCELRILFYVEILIGDETVHSQLTPSQPPHPGQRTKITLPIIKYPDERKRWMGPISIWALKTLYLI